MKSGVRFSCSERLAKCVRTPKSANQRRSCVAERDNHARVLFGIHAGRQKEDSLLTQRKRWFAGAVAQDSALAMIFAMISSA